MSIIKLNNVYEKYRVKFIQQKEIKWEEISALKDISFEVEKGDVLGVIGKNGAGKTTLLRLIAGMLAPDKGNIEVEGKVSALMALGAGFNQEFTGMENIKLNAAIYGLSSSELKQRINDIVKFADLGKFIDAPIKYYSQGMYMRLAFSLAIFVKPDILLIDDILSVGDEEAKKRCVEQVFSLKREGKTIIVVSHDMIMIDKLCNKVILLEKGRIIHKGKPSSVIPYYLETVGDSRGIAALKKDNLRIVFNNGRLTMSYGETALTKPMGGYVSFFYTSIRSWLPSFNLSWRIKHSAEDNIIAESISDDREVLFLWSLGIGKDSLKCEMKIVKKDIENSHMNLFFACQYQKWYTLEKEGDFPLFISKGNLHDLGLDNSPNGMLAISAHEQNQEYPALILTHEDKNVLFKLLNSGYEQESRVIQWNLRPQEKNSVSIKLFASDSDFREYMDTAKEGFRRQQEIDKQKSLKKEEIDKEGLLRRQQEEAARLRDTRTLRCGCLKLFIDTENKAISLYYKDIKLTAFTGLHSSFLIKGHWYDISSAEWKTEKNNSSMEAVFYWAKFNFTQSWSFCFEKGSLLWRINARHEPGLNLERLKFGIFMKKEYKQFFCGRQQDTFPDDFTVWQDIKLEDNTARKFGLRKIKNLPEILFENNNSFSCVLQNSSDKESCRVLQLSLNDDTLAGKEKLFSSSLRILEDKGAIDSYIKQEKDDFLRRQEEEKNRLLRKKQEEALRIRNLTTIGRGNLKLFADLKCKALRLYYQGREITSNRGIYSILDVSKPGCDFNQCAWDVSKTSDSEMSLNIFYEPISLSQIWHLSCHDEDSLSVKISNKPLQDIMFINQDIKVELNDIFQNWSTRYEEGDFNITDYIGDTGPVRLGNNKISQILLRNNKKPDKESFLFEFFSDLERQIVDISKRKDIKNEYICINTSLTLPIKHKGQSADNKTYFNGKISFGSGLSLKKDADRSDLVNLESKNIKLIFNQGKGQLCWRGNELTKGLCMYTSMRHNGIWYDSYQASWKLKYDNGKKIIATGDWPHLAVSQTWEVVLHGPSDILWKIAMSVYKPIRLDFEQANIMLSPYYTKWFIASHSAGIFSDEYTKKYDILPFRFWYGKTGEIKARASGKDFPAVCFKKDAKYNSFRAIVENTDTVYKARLLQYQRENTDEIKPGEYTYFQGVVNIEPFEQ